MRLKPYLIDTARNETRIITHLVAKLDPERLDFRLSANQRSTIELLRYVSTCLIGPTSFALTGTWDAGKTWGERSKTLTLSAIPGTCDDQVAEFERLLADVSDEDLETRHVTFPWGPNGTLGRILLDLPLRWLTSYKMQVFLHAKASGAQQLGSINLWAGMDAPPQAAKA